MIHENSGACEKCETVFNKYRDFYIPLKEWFKFLQKDYPEFHISCAGRGKKEQETLYGHGASRAQWGQSAHNYNAAIDLFIIDSNSPNIYPVEKFNYVIPPRLGNGFNWYGLPGSPFRELPHIEPIHWRTLVSIGSIHLVE